MSTEDPAPEAGKEGEGIDETIRKVERLYQTVTGQQPPAGEATYSPIPVERDPSEYVEEQISRLLDLLGQAQSLSQTGSAVQAPAWTPPITVCDSGSDIVVRVDLPGVPRDEIQVVTRGNVLTISGTRPATPASEAAVRHTECPSGPFRRTLIMAGAARGAEPSAKLSDGVLEVRVAREGTQATVARPVPVN